MSSIRIDDDGLLAGAVFEHRLATRFLAEPRVAEATIGQPGLHHEVLIDLYESSIDTLHGPHGAADVTRPDRAA